MDRQTESCGSVFRPTLHVAVQNPATTTTVKRAPPAEQAFTGLTGPSRHIATGVWENRVIRGKLWFCDQMADGEVKLIVMLIVVLLEDPYVKVASTN